MISNTVEIEISKNIKIEPALIDYIGNSILWNDAVTSLEAIASWSDLQNLEQLGTVTLNNDGTIFFEPSLVGSTQVKLDVKYSYSNVEQTTEQYLEVIIKDKECSCEIPISKKLDNRLVKDGKALYVPELQVDLTSTYANFKTENLPAPSNIITSEDNIVSLTKAIADDIRDLQEDTVEAIAGVAISALKGVYLKDGVIKYLDYRDSDNIEYFLGVTITSGDVGSKIKVKRAGLLNSDFFNFTSGKVWLGVNGALSQTPPDDGYDLLIGTVVSFNNFLFNIQDPIELE